MQGTKPEVMSPAGYWPQLHAAIEAGADAVYFGLTHFTARAKVGFTLDELPEVMRTLHRRGAKGYVTFNSLIFDSELPDAARGVARIAEAGADAIIVQDLGMVRLARQVVPDLELHASTQMSLTDAEGIRLAQSFGITRVVMARELSLDEIRQIRAQTDCELELFVHGALCVSYSGQCFSSEAWGGRSANRGQCAQACRLPYELLVDGAVKPLGDARYLLSPEDLYAIGQIPQILTLGISALKIEGRYKDADYVALTTRAYRTAVDEAWANAASTLTPVDELHLHQVYSRGFGPHFMGGTNHQAVVRGRAPRHRGIRMGTVVRAASPTVLLRPDRTHALAPLKPGDGVVFDAADWRSPEEHEEGGRLYEVKPRRDGLLELAFANGALDFDRIRTGDWLWRTDDPDMARLIRPYTEATAPVARQSVDVRVTARVGEPLETSWTLTRRPEIQVTVRSAAPLEPAQKRALDADLLRDQFSRLGGTAYELSALELTIEGTPFAPASALNQVRREAVEQLAARQDTVPETTVHDPSATLQRVLNELSHPAPAPSAAPSLHLLVRTPEQLDAALELRPASITLDYLDLYGLQPSVDRVRAAGIPLRIASPRILKPGEDTITRFLLKLGAPILVRSTGLLAALEHGPELTGDFSLNAANAITGRTLLDAGLARITPTHDLNAAQVRELAANLGPASIEVVAYQHLPVFHTEHCVFCRFLSTGTTYKDCGRPCEVHRISLRDANGRAHPVLADVGCRNTVFGAEAQEASAHLDTWLAAGIQHYRLEFAHETAGQVKAITEAFQSTLKGHQTATELTRQLRQQAPGGTTEGSLFIPEGPLVSLR